MWKEWQVTVALRRLRLVPWHAVGPDDRPLATGAWPLRAREHDRPALIDLCQEVGVLLPALAPMDALEAAVQQALERGLLVALEGDVEPPFAPRPKKKPTPPPPPKPEEPPTEVNPLLEPAQLVVVVTKRGKNPDTKAEEPYTRPARQPLTLKTDGAFDGTATFTWDKPDKVKIYSAAKDGTEVKVDGASNVWKHKAPPAWAAGTSLSAGVTVYVEAAAASGGMDDITAKLSLSGGSRPTGADRKSTITSVELTLDLCQSRIGGAAPQPMPPGEKAFRGRFLCARHPKRDIERAKLVVQQAKPAAFTGKLELAVSGPVKLYAAEKRPGGKPPPAEAEIAVPVVLENASLGTPKEYWVEGTAASGALRDAELKLGIQGGEAEGDLARISNVTVHFEASPRQKWGYDSLGDPEAAHHHISVKKNGDTVATCKVGGPITGGGAPKDVLFFVCEDGAVADVPKPAKLEPSFDLTIEGKDTDKGATFLRARINHAKGPICASLQVHVYKLKEVEVTVLKAYDSASADTALTHDTFDVEAAETAINKWYKPAVVQINLKDHSATGAAKDIRYDRNGNGTLDLEPAGTSPEEQAIKDAFNVAGQKVVIVKDLSWIYYLQTAGRVGDTKVKLKSAYSGYMKYIGVGETYNLGSGAGREAITVKSKTGTEVELESALTKAHPTTDGLLWPLSGLSGNPIWVAEQTKTLEKERQTIGHENGHSLLKWLDLDAVKNLMHFSSGRTDTQIRYKALPKKYEAGTEIQWDQVPREDPPP